MNTFSLTPANAGYDYSTWNESAQCWEGEGQCRLDWDESVDVPAALCVEGNSLSFTLEFLDAAGPTETTCVLYLYLGQSYYVTIYSEAMPSALKATGVFEVTIPFWFRDGWVSSYFPEAMCELGSADTWVATAFTGFSVHFGSRADYGQRRWRLSDVSVVAGEIATSSGGVVPFSFNQDLWAYQRTGTPEVCATNTANNTWVIDTSCQEAGVYEDGYDIAFSCSVEGMRPTSLLLEMEFTEYNPGWPSYLNGPFSIIFLAVSTEDPLNEWGDTNYVVVGLWDTSSLLPGANQQNIDLCWYGIGVEAGLAGVAFIDQRSYGSEGMATLKISDAAVFYWTSYKLTKEVA